MGQRVGVLLNDGGAALVPGVVVRLSADTVSAQTLGRGVVTYARAHGYIEPLCTAEVTETFRPFWERIEAQIVATSEGLVSE